GRWERDAVDVGVLSALDARTKAFLTDGKGVWSWPPDAGVKPVDWRCRPLAGPTRRDRQATETTKPGLRGEPAISRKAIAQGMPVVPALPVVTAACVSCCRRAMGAASIRHSLRPRFFRGDVSCITRTFVPRECEAVPSRLF